MNYTNFFHFKTYVSNFTTCWNSCNSVKIPVINPGNMKIEEYILHEDENLVAINKPSGLLTIPDREGKDISLKQILKAKYGDIFTVHRLDKDTSGVVVFAKNEQTHKELSKLFEARETTKIYNGFVLGTPFQ